MSITGIFEQNRRSSSKIYGVITGIVTNNQDPDELGRVKIKIPRISGEDESGLFLLWQEKTGVHFSYQR